MEAVKCIKERRSTRKFKAESVAKDVIEEIVSAAAYAPSWKNTQIARYYVLDGQLKDRIASEGVMGFEFNKKTIMRAPQLVIVTYVEKRSGFERDGSFSTSKGDRWESFDAGIATQTFCLAAHDKGVATCILGIFDDNKVAEIAEIPEGQKVAALVAFGYAEGDLPEAPKRKEVSDLLVIK